MEKSKEFSKQATGLIHRWTFLVMGEIWEKKTPAQYFLLQCSSISALLWFIQFWEEPGNFFEVGQEGLMSFFYSLYSCSHTALISAGTFQLCNMIDMSCVFSLSCYKKCSWSVKLLVLQWDTVSYMSRLLCLAGQQQEVRFVVHCSSQWDNVYWAHGEVPSLTYTAAPLHPKLSPAPGEAVLK